MSIEQGESASATVAMITIPNVTTLGDGQLIHAAISELHRSLAELRETYDEIQIFSTISGAIIIILDSSQYDQIAIIEKAKLAAQNKGIPTRIGVSHGDVSALIDVDESVTWIGRPVNWAARLTYSAENRGYLFHEFFLRHVEVKLGGGHYLHPSKRGEALQVKGKRDEVFVCFPGQEPDSLNTILEEKLSQFAEPAQKWRSMCLIAYDLPNFSAGDRQELTHRFKTVAEEFNNIRDSGAELFLSPGGDGGVVGLLSTKEKVFSLAIELSENLLTESYLRTEAASVEARVGVHYGEVSLYVNAMGVERPIGIEIFRADNMIGDSVARRHSGMIVGSAFEDAISRGSSRRFEELFVEIEPITNADGEPVVRRFIKRPSDPRPH